MSEDAQAATARPFAGRYVLGEVLGTGGMSTVYRAKDQVLGRTIALKVLGQHAGDPDLLKRDASEIAVLAALNHHALVTLYDANVATLGDEQRSFLAMELVDGPTLDARIHSGKIDPDDLNRMLLDLSEALHVVHTAGIVHRDIKPGNILLAPTHLAGREFSAKLADFGIAALVDATRITATGTVVGTAAYLSPEQAAGHPAGPASDIYSLGLVVLEAITGTREFPGTLIETLTARMNRDPHIPGDLGYQWKSILTAMTVRDPKQRISAAEVHERAKELQAEPVQMSTATAEISTTAAATLPSGTTPDDTEPIPTRRLARAAATTHAPTRGRRRMIIGISAATVVIATLLLGAVTLANTFGFPDRSNTVPASTDTPAPASTTRTIAPSPTTPALSSTNPQPAVEPDTSPAPVSPAASAAPVAPVTAPAAPAPTAKPPATSPSKSGGNGNGNGNGNGRSKPKK